MLFSCLKDKFRQNFTKFILFSEEYREIAIVRGRKFEIQLDNVNNERFETTIGLINITERLCTWWSFASSLSVRAVVLRS